MTKILFLLFILLSSQPAFGDVFQPEDNCVRDGEVCFYEGDASSAEFGVCGSVPDCTESECERSCVLGACPEDARVGDDCTLGPFRGKCRTASDTTLYCNADDEVDEAANGPSCSTTNTPPTSGLFVVFMLGLFAARREM